MYPAKLDRRGYVKINKSLCNTVGWEPETQLEVEPMGNSALILRKQHPSCSLCGEQGVPLFPVGNGLICVHCLHDANCAAGKK